MKNLLAFLVLLKFRDGPIRKLKNNYREKCDRRNEPNLVFFAKLLPTPSQIKNVLAVLKSRDSHIRNLKKEMQKKKCDTRNAPNLSIYRKTVADTLSNKERFDVFGCFEVSR